MLSAIQDSRRLRASVTFFLLCNWHNIELRENLFGQQQIEIEQKWYTGRVMDADKPEITTIFKAAKNNIHNWLKSRWNVISPLVFLYTKYVQNEKRKQTQNEEYRIFDKSCVHSNDNQNIAAMCVILYFLIKPANWYRNSKLF